VTSGAHATVRVAADDGPALGPRVSSSANEAATLEFAPTYDAHVDFVWRTLWRLGVPQESLQDAVQDVFLVVHRRRADFNGRSTVRTWIFGIVLRVAKDYRRALRRKRPTTPLDDELPDGAADPGTRTERNEGLRVLARVLDQLDDDKRTVFVMSELEQMSVPEMAEALGANPNTIYSRLRTARDEFERAVTRYRRGQR
jgi:RNA polymerase sigma-70 factor (ECF subfamily)